MSAIVSFDESNYHHMANINYYFDGEADHAIHYGGDIIQSILQHGMKFVKDVASNPEVQKKAKEVGSEVLSTAISEVRKQINKKSESKPKSRADERIERLFSKNNVNVGKL